MDSAALSLPVAAKTDLLDERHPRSSFEERASPHHVLYTAR
jgi:hypothetical protein